MTELLPKLFVIYYWIKNQIKTARQWGILYLIYASRDDWNSRGVYFAAGSDVCTRQWAMAPPASHNLIFYSFFFLPQLYRLIAIPGVFGLGVNQSKHFNFSPSAGCRDDDFFFTFPLHQAEAIVIARVFFLRTVLNSWRLSCQTRSQVRKQRVPSRKTTSHVKFDYAIGVDFIGGINVFLLQKTSRRKNNAHGLNAK